MFAQARNMGSYSLADKLSGLFKRVSDHAQPGKVRRVRSPSAVFALLEYD
jgi:hypothetical protein